MTSKPILKDKEREIIRAIHKHGGFMTAHEISKYTGISYVTVKKYLDKLYKEEILIKHGEEESYKNKK